jgi:hypothetical protein
MKRELSAKVCAGTQFHVVIPNRIVCGRFEESAVRIILASLSGAERNVQRTAPFKQSRFAVTYASSLPLARERLRVTQTREGTTQGAGASAPT